MNCQKPSLWILAGLVLIIVSVLILLPGAAPLPVLAQPLFDPQTPPSFHTIADSSIPTSVTKDADGYTVWTYEYPGSWCVMYSRIRWPFNLGAQDPSDLSETSLRLTFTEEPYAVSTEGEPLYTDPTWAVALNGKPGAWTDGAFTGEWNIIGTISTEPTYSKAPVEQEITFDYTNLINSDYNPIIDGENNLWFQQQDFCNCSGMADCACTCYDLSKVQLRAKVKLSIKSVSPEPDTRNVWPDQGKKAQDSEIRVGFTTLVSPTTVNEQTFQVYYFDKDVNKVYVAGKVEPISEVEYAFVPTTKLLPGVQYLAQVWGENDASTHNHDVWVKDLSGGPLEEGQLWAFWTLPDLQITVKPVQVLEDMLLIANKPTVLRAFARWDAPEGVFWKSVVPDVLVEDVVLTWLSPGSTVWKRSGWSDPGPWLPSFAPKTALHKREYRIFTYKEESYDLHEKRNLRDSFNYFGFTPVDTGIYTFEFTVWVKDSRGRNHPFRGSTTTSATAENTFPLRMRAVAVGPDYGKTGTVDLSTLIHYSVRGMRALYPVPDVLSPRAPSAMDYYTPTTTGWTVDWTSPPKWPYYSEELYLLSEMNTLCVLSDDCWAMIGLVNKNWLNTPGTTQRESAPMGALVRDDSNTTGKRYVTAHEVGHLAHIDYHYEGPSDSGFDVIGRGIKNAEQGHTDFMTAVPEQIGDVSLWITGQHYMVLWQWILDHGAAGTQQAMQPAFTTSADPLLVVNGIISPTTDAVTLLPWYQRDAGNFVAPSPGPYKIVFLNASKQEIVGYTRPFTVNTTLRYAGEALTTNGGPAVFTFATPYPAATAKIQIRRVADAAVLAEITPAATPPTVTIQPPGSVWRGSQVLNWQTDPGTRYFAVDVSTDNGATWEALAFNLTAPTYTLQTTALPNTSGAMIRISATDGLRTTNAVAGPFTIDNPPLVGYVDPPGGAEDVGVWTSLEAGFRDAMAPASINDNTFTLTGGPFGKVKGSVTYATATHAATFTPAAPLAYATRYTATLTTGVRGTNGQNLPVTHIWTFTTEVDMAPPAPIAVSPQDGAVNVPRNVTLSVVWDRKLNTSTLNKTTFVLATASGTEVIGKVTYNAATRTANFVPATALMTDTLYIATLKTGIASTDGYTTTGDFNWAFIAGRETGGALAFTGGYNDSGQDTNGDGLYEQLVIRVGVQVTATGSYILRGTLADLDGGEIAWDYITRTLTAGAHFLELGFDGTAIGGHNVDGPYMLTDLTLVQTNSLVNPVLLASTSKRNAYRTFAYTAEKFPAPLVFSGLPDVQLLPGTTSLNAFNVRTYAHHATLPSYQLKYTIMLDSNPRMGVDLQPSGAIDISPEPYWKGKTRVTIRASDGVYAVQDTFEATIGWPNTIYLPVVVRNYDGETVIATRDAWITLLYDDFEGESFGWTRYTSIYGPPDGPGGLYHWVKRDCAAYSGQYSAWPYGGGDDGELLACGAEYPITLYSIMYKSAPVNLKYTGQGTYSAKVWTNLAPGARVCLNVAVLESGTCDGYWGPQGDYHGICRSGQTNGWEDLTLDLANVPVLGNVLDKERVCLNVDFYGGKSGTRPEGAYVDDVNLRVCPEGLNDYCAPSTASSASESTVTQKDTVLVTGNVGGYPESISEAALAVDATGRIHALWTGKLNPIFENFVFYSSSTNGVNWTPYKILNYWGGREPRIAVDNAHGRVHLAYGSIHDGIIHHTVVNGIVSDPVVVAPQQFYYLPDFSLPSGGVAWPSLAVAENSGDAYILWLESHWMRKYSGSYSLRFRTWHATWNGTTWSAPLRKINDNDTFYSSIAVTPDGRAMMAWFQRWVQSSGGGLGPGDPIVARTAYGEEPGSFPLRQATHDLYPVPERDESILLAYSGGDDSFVLVSNHAMWPGHTRVYRYVWKDGSWSQPLNVAENNSGFAVPVYVGAAMDTPLIRYVYYDSGFLIMRSETNGTLSAAQTVATYLSTRGYTNTGIPHAYFTNAAGGLSMLISGEKNGAQGFYYVQP